MCLLGNFGLHCFHFTSELSTNIDSRWSIAIILWKLMEDGYQDSKLHKALKDFYSFKILFAHMKTGSFHWKFVGIARILHGLVFSLCSKQLL